MHKPLLELCLLSTVLSLMPQLGTSSTRNQHWHWHRTSDRALRLRRTLEDLPRPLPDTSQVVTLSATSTVAPPSWTDSTSTSRENRLDISNRHVASPVLMHVICASNIIISRPQDLSSRLTRQGLDIPFESARSDGRSRPDPGPHDLLHPPPPPP
ncbi:hypothetical protein GY45DRAFT_1118110 [Cubamyces sp. BRFM 1775]|nr:hypothetical protein GY45DRAFT_1118110 [Cubamyces sp. BRFM 1775]